MTNRSLKGTGLALDPGGAFTHGFYATSLTIAGRSEEAIPIFQKAIRLDPAGSASLYVKLQCRSSVYGTI